MLKNFMWFIARVLVSIFDSKFGQIFHLRKLIHPIRKSYLVAYELSRRFQNAFLANVVHARKRAEFKKVLEQRRGNTLGLFIQSHCIEWNVPLFQRPQHMARALSQAGFIVVYLTPNIWHDNVNGYDEIEPNLFLTNDLRLVFNISNAFVSCYSTSSAYVPREIEEIRAKGNKIIYEYIDHIDPKISWSYVSKLQSVFDYISRDTVDYVFVSSRLLAKEMAEKVDDDQMLSVPNGVDFLHYQNSLRGDKRTIPKELIEFVNSGQPIVGYFGAIAPWLWFELIEEFVEDCPDFNFLFIGPDYLGASERLPKRENFLHLGPIDYKQLPLYACCFTIGIIPFALGKIARTTSPLKLFEYFALGKPVVVTSEMYECTVYPEVLHAADPKEFRACMQRAINYSKDDKYKDLLVKHATNNTWQCRARSVVEILSKFESTDGCPLPVNEIQQSNSTLVSGNTS